MLLLNLYDFKNQNVDLHLQLMAAEIYRKNDYNLKQILKFSIKVVVWIRIRCHWSKTIHSKNYKTTLYLQKF